jgi:hypothetical protein
LAESDDQGVGLGLGVDEALAKSAGVVVFGFPGFGLTAEMVVLFGVAFSGAGAELLLQVVLGFTHGLALDARFDVGGILTDAEPAKAIVEGYAAAFKGSFGEVTIYGVFHGFGVGWDFIDVEGWVWWAWCGSDEGRR